jgi:predicted membrane chloride channel (bestrophin family)
MTLKVFGQLEIDIERLQMQIWRDPERNACGVRAGDAHACHAIEHLIEWYFRSQKQMSELRTVLDAERERVKKLEITLREFGE